MGHINICMTICTFETVILGFALVRGNNSLWFFCLDLLTRRKLQNVASLHSAMENIISM